ncbi:membrane protein, toxin regulator-like protein, partial [Lacticaseibacillus rhamnosus MTCC 5462]
VGMVGPLASLDAGLAIPLVLLCWFAVPIAAALLSKLLFEKHSSYLIVKLSLSFGIG